MANIKELKQLIEKAPPLPWSGPTDTEGDAHPEDYVFRDANNEPTIYSIWYDGALLAAEPEVENLVVLGINSLPELIGRIEELEEEVTILREELQDCLADLAGEDF